MSKIIQRVIRLPYSKIGCDQKESLTEVINNMLPACTEDGYITGLRRIISIDSNIICNVEGHLLCKATYDVNIVCPIVGAIYSGNVCLVFEHGHLVMVQDVLKVFVVYKDENKKYKEGSRVRIEITKIKFSVFPKPSFSCIGFIV